MAVSVALQGDVRNAHCSVTDKVSEKLSPSNGGASNQTGREGDAES